MMPAGLPLGAGPGFQTDEDPDDVDPTDVDTGNRSGPCVKSWAGTGEGGLSENRAVCFDGREGATAQDR